MSVRLRALLGIATALAVGCGGDEPAGDQPLVLLVSFDTTRADALGCYGNDKARTPTLDGLAQSGVRFAWALSQSPTTLASHTAALSGLDSHGHRVVRNGFPVPPDIPLATERFAAAGWDTVAVLGSVVLEASMGLGRGFRIYEDGAWLRYMGKFAFPADQVTDRALTAVDERNRDQPLFLFVHYYDPHTPWQHAPEALREGFVDPTYTGVVGPTLDDAIATSRKAQAGQLTAADVRQAKGHYWAEVAWADQQLGRLLDGLADRGLMDDAFVVMMADHGEILDEIPERSFRHGPDVDLGAIHVPLIVRGTGRFSVPGGRVVEQPVRVQDLAGTLLGAAGLDATIGESRDLSVTWTDGAAPLAPVPSFAEATRPHEVTNVETWPNLLLERGVAHDGHLLTRAPWLDEEQLYRIDVAQTPVEDPARTAALGALLDAWDARAPGAREVELSDETRAALEALGYLDPGGG